MSLSTEWLASSLTLSVSPSGCSQDNDPDEGGEVKRVHDGELGVGNVRSGYTMEGVRSLMTIWRR